MRLQALHSSTPAVPLASYAADRSSTRGCDDNGKESNEDGMRSFVDTDENAYVTRPFYIRYNDHTACLCEVAHFRLQLDCHTDLRDTEDILVRFDLHFAVRPPVGVLGQGPPKPEQYSVISTHDFQLRGAIHLGGHHLVPLSFEEHSVCWATVAIHAVLVATKPAPPRGSGAPGTPCSQSDSVSIAPTMEGVEPPVATVCGGHAHTCASARPLESMLGHGGNVSLCDADKFAREYMTPLVASFISLRSTLHALQAQVVNPISQLTGSTQLETVEYKSYPPFPDSQRRRLPLPAGCVSASQLMAAAAAWIYSQLTNLGTGEIDGTDHSRPHVPVAQVAETVESVVCDISFHLYRLWHSFLLLCQAVPHALSQLLACRHRLDERRRWELGILRAQTAPLEALVNPTASQIDTEQISTAAALRCSEAYQQAAGWHGIAPGASLHDMCLPAGTFTTQHVIFEENYAPRRNVGLSDTVREGEGFLFVFCHGFQGNQYDLRYFRNRVGIKYPKARLLCCSSVEDNTHAAIEVQGMLVADELARYISGMDNPSSVWRISFIGHSLGTLVIRAALTLPTMKPYLDRLHSFVSLGGTHLGYTFGNNSFLSSAMWVYQRWTKSTALRQLNLRDSPSPKSGFVSSLAHQDTLAKFKQVILIASGQDRYAPFYSARIQIAPGATQTSGIGSASIAMVTALMQPILDQRKTQVTRLGVCFGRSHGALLDSAIGRAAHIQFLEDHALLHRLVASVGLSPSLLSIAHDLTSLTSDLGLFLVAVPITEITVSTWQQLVIGGGKSIARSYNSLSCWSH